MNVCVPMMSLGRRSGVHCILENLPLTDSVTILAAVGNYTPDGTAAFVRAYLYDTAKGTHTFLALPLQYKSIRFPAMNARWIVYLDAVANGGGGLMAYDRQTQEAKALKAVHTGLVRPVLYGDTAVWIERTGQSRDKLFAVDLNTGESATIAIFDGSPYALSKPLGLILGVAVGAIAVNLLSPSLGYVALFPTAIVCVIIAVVLPLLADRAKDN